MLADQNVVTTLCLTPKVGPPGSREVEAAAPGEHHCSAIAGSSCSFLKIKRHLGKNVAYCALHASVNNFSCRIVMDVARCALTEVTHDLT